MRIALVFPRFKYPSGDIPLGIAYLTAFLQKKINCTIEVVDPTFERFPLKFVEQHFSQNSYDIVGISTSTPQIEEVFEVAKIAKKYNPQTTVVLGGPHPTVLPDHTLSCDSVDIACIGEGEETFFELVRDISDLKNIRGIAYRSGGEVVRNVGRDPISNLDDLPMPVYDVFDMKKYLSAFSQIDVVSPYYRGVNIMASRGCPFQCSYCQPTLRKIFGNKMRVHSPAYVIEMLKGLKDRYAIDSFFFADDTLNINKKWVADLCQGLNKDNMNLIWGCNVRADLVDYEMLNQMKNAGLRKVNIGIEAGSQRILDEIYQKKITLEQVTSSVEILNSLKLKIHGYFMLGAPSETVDEIKSTIALARKIDIDDAMFSITTPLPKTYLYDRSKESISDDFGKFDYYKHSVYKSSDVVDQRTLNRLRKKAVLGFYLRPKSLLRLLKQALRRGGIKKILLKLKRF